jgi:hypothetical protein
MEMPIPAPVRARMPSARARATGSLTGPSVAMRARGDVREGGLEGVVVDDGAAKKVARAAGDGGDALGEEAAGAAFGGGEREVAHAEVEEDDLFERLAVRRRRWRRPSRLRSSRELVDAGLGFGEGGFGAEEVELDLGGRRGWWSRCRGTACRWGRCGRRPGLGDEGHAEDALGEMALGDEEAARRA